MDFTTGISSKKGMKLFQKMHKYLYNFYCVSVWTITVCHTLRQRECTRVLGKLNLPKFESSEKRTQIEIVHITKVHTKQQVINCQGMFFKFLNSYFLLLFCFFKQLYGIFLGGWEATFRIFSQFSRGYVYSLP